MFKFCFGIYDELFVQRKHHDGTCTHLQINSMIYVKLPIHTGPACVHSDKRAVSNSRHICYSLDDDLVFTLMCMFTNVLCVINHYALWQNIKAI